MDQVLAMGSPRSHPRQHPVLSGLVHEALRYRTTLAYCLIVLLTLWVSEMVYAR